MTVKPNPAPARVAMVFIGPRVTNSTFVVRPQSIADLPRVPVVVVDFYPLPPSRAAQISHKQEVQTHGS